MGDLKRNGRVGLKALFYFEGVSTLALIIGLLVVNWVKLGAGLNASAAMLNAKLVADYATAAPPTSAVEFQLHIIPDTFSGAFTQGDILQVLFVSILFGFALAKCGEQAQPVLAGLQEVAKVFFGIVNFITRFAPVAAFGAMAFTIGKFGVGSLLSLGRLMLGVISPVFCSSASCSAWLHGFSVFRLLAYIKEERSIVLGTSSSESVLPRMMQRMEEIGCARPWWDRAPGRLFVQSRWDVHLSDDGGNFCRAGDEHTADARQSVDDSRSALADVKGAAG